MKKLYFLLLTVLSVSVGFAQGSETFDNFTETGSSYASGTFTGNDGSTWTYVESRGDFSITGKSIMLGRNRTPQAELTSGTITGGIGTINFNYQRAYSTNVNLNILVNGIVVGNVTSTDATVQNSGTFTVNQPGDVVIQFISVNNSDGQVVIDDITWTGYTGTASPILAITSPSDNQEFVSGTTSVDISTTVQNFTVDALPSNGGTGDGHIHWTVNGIDQPMKYDLLDETIPTVDGGTYVVVMTLVDNMHTPITPAVTETVTFTVAYPCTLNVGAIVETCNTITPATTDTYNVSIDYTGGGNSTYTIDTGGNGTVGGDDPSTVAAGTIVISNILEGTDFTVTFTGDPANSGCDFTRNINSPNCDPQLILPITEPFSYPDGSLVGNSDWETTSGNAGDLLVTSGQITVQHGTPSEDVALPFTAVTGDLFYSFDMSIADLGSPYSGTDNEYFAHFRGVDNTFLARLDVVPPSGAGDFSLGIATNASTAEATWATDLLYGTVYRVTVRYDQDTNIAQLWVDAASETDTSILGLDGTDPGEVIASFAFRQSDSSLNEGIVVDNLIISETFAQTLSNTEFNTPITNFSVYPNPTNTGYVNITTPSNTAVKVTVYDVLGKQVLTKTLNNNRLNVSSLKSGIYILHLNQNGTSTTKKLVVN